MNLDRAQHAARRLVDPLLAVVFPSACPGCGALLAHPGAGPLCEACWRALPRHRAAACGCGLPLLPGAACCGRCRRGRQPFAAGASLGPYEGSLRVLLHQLKYAGRRRAAARLAALLLEEEPVVRLLQTSEVLVPVPLHPRRLRERGFNQSALIAEALALRCGCRFCPDALVRRRDTAPQAGLTAKQRRGNVQGAFVVRRRAGVCGKVVTLVDDVVTTGATAQACARALLEAGAAELRLLTAARA
ncbi:MAG TPA: double zinc ribbon domain-containing protein [Vicinamibacteria bacterium]|nr:double zinc ribbon domain-containing protein [Vicinamibacteria bacterium]